MQKQEFYKILFVCHGNICRSPMAEFVMKQMVQDAHLSAHFEIASAATSTEEIGCSIYPPVKKLLEKAGINCSQKRARQFTPKDYTYYDFIILMDQNNFYNIQYLLPQKRDTQNKISLLLDWTHRKGDVADPWYTRDFNATWRDIHEGCTAILKKLGGL